MRLLQVSLRSLLLYALVLVFISIPVSIYTIREVIQKEVDESLQLDRQEFVQHLKNFEYLADLEIDLQVLDQLTHDISLTPAALSGPQERFRTVETVGQKPVREMTTQINVKGKPYILSIRKSLEASERLARAILEVQLAVIILLVAGLIVINGSLSKRLWQPFYATLSKLKEYELDKHPSFEYVNTNIVEFDDLNTAIEHLTEKNRLLFQQQKEFIENASHELQTPIAIFQSKLDILMQQPGLNEQQATLIAELESTSRRMARLNRSIVLLSKIDNEQFSDVEMVSLDKQIADHLEQVNSLMRIQKITLTLDLEPTMVKGNKALLEILIQNLVSNAKRHNFPGGQVNIVLKHKQLIISNTGLPVQNPDKMFERFSKESSANESLGLGLAIVKKICAISHYTLSYSYEHGMHKFSVNFES